MNPTEDLQARCREILAWHKTGLLTGSALRDYASRQWYANEHNSLQLAEADTAKQAFTLIAAAQEPVGEVIHTALGCVDWIISPRDLPKSTKLYTAPPAVEQPDTVPVPMELAKRICHEEKEQAEMILVSRARAIAELRALLGKEDVIMAAIKKGPEGP